MLRIPRLPTPRTRRPDPAQRGIALAVVMMVMIVLTLFGVMILMQTDTNMMIGRYERDTAACRTAAEAAARAGIADAITHYNPTNRFNSLLVCNSSPPCPPPPTGGNNYLQSKYIVDFPGNPYLAGAAGTQTDWRLRLYSGNGPGDRTSIYTTVYARNNAVESNPTVDNDSQIVVVGEAVMTEDGSPPTTSPSNVRVRKVIAAEIRPPRSSTGGGSSHSGGNTGTGYGG